MKKVMSKTKTLFATMMIIGTVLTSSVYANTNPDLPGVQVKYLGTQESNPVFEIVFNNKEVDKYLITIRDESGNILFSEKLSGRNITRKYRIDTEVEIGEGGLRFEIKPYSTKKTQVYVAGLTETVSKDMAVSRLY